MISDAGGQVSVVVSQWLRDGEWGWAEGVCEWCVVGALY